MPVVEVVGVARARRAIFLHVASMLVLIGMILRLRAGVMAGTTTGAAGAQRTVVGVTVEFGGVGAVGAVRGVVGRAFVDLIGAGIGLGLDPMRGLAIIGHALLVDRRILVLARIGGAVAVVIAARILAFAIVVARHRPFAAILRVGCAGQGGGGKQGSDKQTGHRGVSWNGLPMG